MTELAQPYIATVDLLRSSPNRDFKTKDQIVTISQDRALVASYLIGTQYTSMIAVWVERELPDRDRMQFISNYIPHVEGFLQVIFSQLDNRCSESVKRAYCLIERHQSTIPSQREPCFGKGIWTGMLLSVFLVEFWKQTLLDQCEVLPFPANPGFIHPTFLHRAHNVAPDIKRWLDEKGYLVLLPLNSLLDDLEEVLQAPPS